MRILLLAVMAAVVIGGGGAGGYFYFNKPAEAASDKKKDKHGDGKGGLEEAFFVRLDPLILPVMGDYGVSETISMVVVIEVPDDKTKEKVKILSPRLKDAYIQDLYGTLNKNYALRDGVVQVGMVKGRLTKISHRILGEENVKDVLLEVVQQRPL